MQVDKSPDFQLLSKKRLEFIQSNNISIFVVVDYRSNAGRKDRLIPPVNYKERGYRIQ